MQMSRRRVLASGLALLIAAPGPAFAAQVVSVARPSGASGVVSGTAGLGRGAALGGASLVGASLLSPSLQGASLLAAPAVRGGVAAAVGTSVLPVSAPQVQPAVLTQVLAGVSPAPASVTAAAPVAAVVAEVRTLLKGGPAAQNPQAAPSPISAKSSWDAFWSRSRAPAPEETTVPGTESAPAPLAAPIIPGTPSAAVPAPAQAEPAAKKEPGFWRSMALPLGLAAVWGAARFALPARAPAFWLKAAPYVSGAGFLLAAYALNGLARRGVDLLAKRLHWKPGTVMAARFGASVLIYAAGGALALHAVGVSTATLLATFGIGGVAMTMAAKEFIGNFMEGVKMLLNRPFAINDRVKIGTQEYTVSDMDLRYMHLARPDGGVTLMTYTQISEKPVTVLREYAHQRRPGSLTSSLWSGMGRLVKAMPKPSLLKASLWTALGVGLVVALPLLPSLLPVNILAAAPAWLSYLKAGMALVAAHSLEKGSVGFIRRLAESRDWPPQQAVVMKLAVQLGVYLVGGTVALHFLGMTWATLLASLGATSIALGWASADFIGNLIQGFWIVATHPFTVGDRIEVGTVSGTVADMNMSYVVLKHDDHSHTLLPYAVLKVSPFTVLSKAPDPEKK
ncbi:MAG: mechanosensitive ion channel [Elusimicrobia bacterium]|nr:mechanosensitive ion channel [Elusimicrobiota bacterium]